MNRVKRSTITFQINNDKEKICLNFLSKRNHDNYPLNDVALLS